MFEPLGDYRDDDDSTNPDDLQGASRTTGGIFRGKAVGNVPAFADMEFESTQTIPQTKGRVFLHMSDSGPYSMSHPVGSKLGPVLNGLAKLYSPIKRQNARISVQEDGIWTLKGRYSNALRITEDLPWVKDDQGLWSVTLQAEDLQAESSPKEGDGGFLPSGILARPSRVSAQTSTALQEQLRVILNIPESLTTRGRGNDLRLAYAKYKGVLKARTDMQQMKVDGTWTLGNVSTDTLIEMFVSKTVWYTYYTKLFPRVAKWLDLLKWMDNEPDAKSSYDIWGSEKASYSFQELKELLNWLDTRANKKREKRKNRDSEESGSSAKKQKLAKSNDVVDVFM